MLCMVGALLSPEGIDLDETGHVKIKNFFY